MYGEIPLYEHLKDAVSRLTCIEKKRAAEKRGGFTAPSSPEENFPQGSRPIPGWTGGVS